MIPPQVINRSRTTAAKDIPSSMSIRWQIQYTDAAGIAGFTDGEPCTHAFQVMTVSLECDDKALRSSFLLYHYGTISPIEVLLTGMY